MAAGTRYFAGLHALAILAGSRAHAIYEPTPVQFLQLRAGVRDYYGPSSVRSQRSKLLFARLQAFF